jgi:hypothetical protein
MDNVIWNAAGISLRSDSVTDVRQVHGTGTASSLLKVLILYRLKTYNDFRHFVVDRFLEILKKEDPRFRRPRF